MSPEEDKAVPWLTTKEKIFYPVLTALVIALLAALWDVWIKTLYTEHLKRIPIDALWIIIALLLIGIWALIITIRQKNRTLQASVNLIKNREAKAIPSISDEKAINELEQYSDELNNIKSRFTKDSDGYIMAIKDYPKFRTIVTEASDLLDDFFGNHNYSSQINHEFQQGISNFGQIPSYRSVTEIDSVIKSALTRIKRNSTA